ncbi:MAG: DNA mismatch repair endonuclease MutL [Planctomycetota bacterium]|nr:MAG: DNA mismatch repair endonuclease MutL [Planctomycetota bacterium]
MGLIRQLPPALVNKIAAGEVIERPASVVKELLENSIDAGANHIEISLEGGGTDLIRIADDGSGIDREDIPLAIASHATSKLQSADDLFQIRTLGFRGEALASIAEVSHLTLRTRTAESESGYEITIRGGQASDIQPIGHPVGTTIEVRNLFFNTPVRRKFLKTAQTEAGHITEAFTRIALAYPQVHMKLTSGNRVVHDLPAVDRWRERIGAFFGPEVCDSLIWVEDQQEHVRLSGYVADPAVSRGNNRMQYLFLNGRFIRDRSLQHALAEAYRGLLMVGRFPICFLRLELPPSQVDVNVHPTKMEVRFQDGGRIYSQLLKTVRHRFLTTDLTARVGSAVGTSAAATPAEPATAAAGASPGFAAGHAAAPAARPQDRRWDAYAEQMATVEQRQAHLPLTGAIPPFQPFPSRTGPGTAAAAPPVFPPPAAGTDAAAVSGSDLDTTSSPPSASPPPDALATQPSQPAAEEPAMSNLGFQIHNRYLVTQDEKGMVVIDQHALHERILYEQLRARTESRPLETQSLLVPEPVDLPPAEAAAALENKEVLARVGIEIEPFGGDTVLITSYPAMLANMRPSDVLRAVLEPLLAGGKDVSARDLFDELLHMLACKAAVKAGDKLSPDEISALLEQRYHYQDTHHCPHGRPTALFFSRQQLDKMFGRI